MGENRETSPAPPPVLEDLSFGNHERTAGDDAEAAPQPGFFSSERADSPVSDADDEGLELDEWLAKHHGFSNEEEPERPIEALDGDQVRGLVELIDEGGLESYKKLLRKVSELGVWRDGVAKLPAVKEAVGRALVRDLGLADTYAVNMLLTATGYLKCASNEEIARLPGIGEAASTAVTVAFLAGEYDPTYRQFGNLAEHTNFVDIAIAHDQGLREMIGRKDAHERQNAINFQRHAQKQPEVIQKRDGGGLVGFVRAMVAWLGKK
jgi:hypothetical protein